MKVMTHLSEKKQLHVGIAPEQERIKRLNTEQLFSNINEVIIEHLNDTYFLRITKQNKLILTK